MNPGADVPAFWALYRGALKNDPPVED